MNETLQLPIPLPQRFHRPRWAAGFVSYLISAIAIAPAGPSSAAEATFIQAAASVQPKMVKIYGAGGLQGLEAYQSGFLISPQGHVLTAWSYVLDTDYITDQ